MATKYMNLDLPTVGVTMNWAQMLNAALEKIDTHNHSSGNGRRIHFSSVFIDGTIDLLNLTNLTASGVENCAYVRLLDRSAATGQPVRRSLFAWRGDLWWNGHYNNTQITQNGQLNTKTINFNSINYTQQAATDYDMTTLENYIMMFITSVAGSQEINLPYASMVVPGRFYIFQDVADASANSIVIRAQASDTIGTGGAGGSHSITTQYGHIWLTSNGTTNWIINSSA